jgi:hypothetical protein
MYVDDITLVTQKTYEVCKVNLTNDVEKLNQYWKKWRLRLNHSKTIFQLNNRQAKHKINISFDGKEIINYHMTPISYLGVTLDRTLIYKNLLTKVATKIKTWNNIIRKIANTNWGSDPNTLRISAMALTYSVALLLCLFIVPQSELTLHTWIKSIYD